MSVWQRALAITFTRTSPALGGATVTSSMESGFFASQAASGTIVSMSSRRMEAGDVGGGGGCGGGRGGWEEGAGMTHRPQPCT